MRVATALLAVIALISACKTDETTCIFVESSQMICTDQACSCSPGNDHENSNQCLLDNHSIVQGHNTVIGIRSYSGGDPLAIDDESFEKITLEISNLPADRTKISVTPRKFLYSSGTSREFNPRPGAYSQSFVGLAEIERHNRDRLTVNLHLNTNLRSSYIYEVQNPIHSVERTISCDRIIPSQLTPWLGSPSGRPARKANPI